MKRELFIALQALRRSRCPAAVVTDVKSGAQALVTAETTEGDLALSEARLDQTRRMLAADSSGPLGELFVRCYGPPWSLALVGAVHIAQALAPMAALAGFGVTVIDPRAAFAARDRFPEARLLNAWPDDAFAAEPPGPHTAVVTLSHDPKIDDPALAAALGSPAFYIGALGSRRTHGGRLQRLGAAGFDPEQLARIAAPVGLDLGGRTPAEIAVAVLAEIVGARHGRRRRR